jgi:hypothetical protein
MKRSVNAASEKVTDFAGASFGAMGGILADWREGVERVSRAMPFVFDHA